MGGGEKRRRRGCGELQKDVHTLRFCNRPTFAWYECDLHKLQHLICPVRVGIMVYS